jgi:ATP-dependent Clp protease ATP-binding subunit ClpC
MKEIFLKPKSTLRGQGVLRNRRLANWFGKLLYILITILAILSVIFVGYEVLSGFSSEFLGIAILFIALFAIFHTEKKFIYKITTFPSFSLVELKKQISSKQSANLFAVFSHNLADATYDLFSTKNIDDVTIKELATVLSADIDLEFILSRLGLSYQDFESYSSSHEAESKALPILLEALEMAEISGHEVIEGGDVLTALCKKDPVYKKMLEALQLDIADIENVVYWLDKVKWEVRSDESIFNHFGMSGGIGRDWAFGYTPYLKQFSVDITEGIQRYGLGLELVGRDKEIQAIEEALSEDNGGNAVVVGDAGIGKKAVIMGFAKKVLDGKTNGYVSHKHVFQVDTDALLSGATDAGELAKRPSWILSEAAYAGNIIIFIENIDNIFSAGGVGQADMSEVLLPYLDRSGIHIIGTSEVAGYNNFILKNGALSQRFVKVSMEEPSEADMVRILEETVPMIEAKTQSLISYEAIKAAIKSANKHLLNQPNPEKSINLLEGVATKVSAERGPSVILPQDVEWYMADKLKIPTGEVSENEKNVLLNMEAELHKFVIGQEEGLKAIADSLRRVRAQVSDSRKPIGSFLFLGPTGVGKTATAKALAKVYFGGEDKMVRFDMSEYQNKEDIYRLIGQRGEAEQGLLVSVVNEKPFSLILFDEIEKADPEILNLLLQVLDEGILTDGNGQKVSFSDTIIIATSNAGANVIRDTIRSGTDFEKSKKNLIDYLVNNNLFRPEFINRFTAVVAFSPLTEDEILLVAKNMITGLIETVKTNKNISIVVSEEAVAALAKAGFDPEMGARPMERAIQDKIENLLAKKILSNELNKGDTYTVTVEDVA